MIDRQNNFPLIVEIVSVILMTYRGGSLSELPLRSSVSGEDVMGLEMNQTWT